MKQTFVRWTCDCCKLVLDIDVTRNTDAQYAGFPLGWEPFGKSKALCPGCVAKVLDLFAKD